MPVDALGRVITSREGGFGEGGGRVRAVERDLAHVHYAAHGLHVDVRERLVCFPVRLPPARWIKIGAAERMKRRLVRIRQQSDTW